MTREELAARVLDAFPAGRYGLLALLQVIDIVPSTEVETAAVECAALPKLLVNTAFVETHAETSEKLVMLVMHELHHVLLGHTRLFERTTPARNLVFDAVINSMLCRMFPNEAYLAMFRDFYSAERFPECLLRPPDDWTPKSKASVPPGLADGGEHIQDSYRALYSETGADYYDLFEALGTAIHGELTGTQLLGDHMGETPELNGTGMLFDAVRDIVERWPQPPNPIRGRSLADAISITKVDRVPVNDRAALASFLRRVAAPRPGSHGRKAFAGYTEAMCPSPRPDRRSVVLGALGSPSLLHRTELPWASARGGIWPVHVYVDVSGSVASLRPVLYGAVASCRELVHPTVHLFSTKVHDVSLPRFLAGECASTGGTDIGCVAAHIKKNRVRRAVLLTDGWVGRPRSGHARTLHACTLGVALTPDSSQRADLDGFADYWIQLKGIK